MRYLFFICVFTPLLAFSQFREDSLLNLINELPEREWDTVYYMIAKDKVLQSDTGAFEYLWLAKKYSEKYNSREILLRILLGYGIMYTRVQNLDSAEYYLKMSVDKSNEFNIDHRLPWIYEALAIVYLTENKFEKSIKYYFMAAKVAEKHNLNRQGLLYNQIGLIELRLGNFNNALDALKTSYERNLSNKSEELVRANLINMAICHVRLSQIEEGKNLVFKLMNLCQNKKDSFDCLKTSLIIETHRLIGEILIAEHKFDSAKYHLFVAFEEITSQNLEKYSSVFKTIGSYYKSTGNTDSALHYYNKSAEYGKLFNNYLDILDVTKRIAEIYYQLGEYQKSTYYFDKALALDDSLRRINEEEKIHASYMDFEEYKTSRLLEAKETIITRNRQLIFFLGVMVLLALTTFFFAYNNARTRKRLNERLSDRVFERTRDLNSFLYRTSHDLAGPIATLKGLLKLAESEKTAREKDVYLGKIKLTADRLEHVIQCLETISSIQVARLKKEKADLKELAKQAIEQVKNGYPIEPEIILNGRKEIYTDKVLFSGLMESLIKNSYDHIDKREQNQKMQIEINNEKNLKIRISDTGTGIIEGQENRIFDLFFTGYDKSVHAGIGLYFARVAAERLGGTISLLHSRKPTIFEVTLPG